MPLKVGSLYVSLTAQTGEFAKGMQGALKSVERFSKEVKKAAGDAMGIGASLTAVGAGALKLASDVSGPTKRALDELSASTKQLAVPIAEALVPAVREASNVIRGIGQAFKELSPETQRAVVTVLEVGAAMTAVGAVVGKLAGTVNLLAGVFSGVFGAIAAIGLGPLLGIVAAIGAVIGAVALLHRAWRLNWGNIQEVTAAVVQGIKLQFTGLVQIIGKVFDWLVDQVATMIDTNLQLVERLQKAFGVQLVDTRGLRAGFQGLFADLKSGEFFNQALQFGKTVGKQVGAGVLEEWELIAKKMGFDKLRKDAQAFIATLMKGAALSVGGQAIDRTKIASSAVARAKELFEVIDLGIVKNLPRQRGPSRISQTSAAEGETARRNFEQFQEEQRQREVAARQAAAQGTKDSLAGTAQQFVARLGELGSVINNVVQAGLQGGPWAALATAVMELLTRTKAFVRLMELANNGLQALQDVAEAGASAFFEGLGQVLAVVVDIASGITQAVEPVFTFFGDVLKNIATLLYPIGTILRALSPVFQMLGEGLQFALKTLRPVLDLVMYVIIGVGIALAWFVTQLGKLWNATVDAITNGFRQYISALAAGFPPAIRQQMEALGQQLLDTVALKQVDTAASEKAMNELIAMGANLEKAKSGPEELADALRGTAAAAAAATEAFLDVPSGYKVAAARFAADAGGLTQFTMPSTAAAGSGVTINGDITVVTNDPDEFMERLRRVEFRHTGAVAANLSRNVR